MRRAFAAGLGLLALALAGCPELQSDYSLREGGLDSSTADDASSDGGSTPRDSTLPSDAEAGAEASTGPQADAAPAFDASGDADATDQDGGVAADAGPAADVVASDAVGSLADGGPADATPDVIPACASGQACVDAIPTGWSGFVQVLVQDPDGGPGCKAPYAQVRSDLGGQTNPDGGPASCGTCTCAPPDSGISCDVTVEQDETGCIYLGAPTEVPAQANTCTMVGGLAGWNGKTSLPVALGSCVAGPSSIVTPPPPPISTAAVVCAVADAGVGTDAGGSGLTVCTLRQTCADVPQGASAGTPSGVCIYQAGTQTCPPSGTTVFTNTYVVGGLQDDRGCGCSCAAQCPSDGYIEGFTASGCTGTPSYSSDAGSACNSSISNSSRPKYVKYVPSRSGSPSTCLLANAGPTGSVTIAPGTATTFCCVP